MMRGRYILCTLLAITTLMGCTPALTPSPMPSATASPTPTVTPIPSATASPSPTPDLRVIDTHPESLILTLEEAGLEGTHAISNCAAVELPEGQETGGSILGWTCDFLALDSNLSNNLNLGLHVHSVSMAAIDAPVLNPSHPSYLEDLDVGDRGAIHYQSSRMPSGSIYHQYSVVFSFRNVFVYLSSGGESVPEDVVEWLTGIAQMQFQKLLSHPLAEEFAGQW